MYTRGKHRLFYQSNSESLQNVEAKIITPNLDTKGPLSMIFVKDGLYYMDVWFTQVGSHVLYVYENGEKKHKEIIVVGDIHRYIVYPNNEYMI